MNKDEKWLNGLSEELTHWRKWLAEGSSAFVGQWDDYACRTSPTSPLLEHNTRPLERHAPRGSLVRILDVGAGPLTGVGKVWEGRKVEITAVDPLAKDYDQLLAEAGVTPLVRTVTAEAERLTDVFPAASFDLVTCQNALDHMYNPLEALGQMLSVVKPGHAIVLLHVFNEAENQAYSGLHQWNCTIEGDEFLIWNPHLRVSVNRLFHAVARVKREPCWADRQFVVSLTRK